ncbi:unnamed protein product [Mytilus edulis]|uniref:PHD-type domain-containing protein n=1 Tax=Mytilus edulis TaxID=6550 RepID=A0A8S3Q6E3_MYTED|nr:unnamed protein product [Mytilus edulis]
MRQYQDDFIHAINDVSRGDLPENTLNLIKRLSRHLPPGEDPIRLCARNCDCFIYNACKLMDMDGEEFDFCALDEGDVSKLERTPVPQHLHIKLGCPVMLLKNLSEHFDNWVWLLVEQEKKGLRIIGFNESSIMRHDPGLYKYYDHTQSKFDDIDFLCCKQHFNTVNNIPCISVIEPLHEELSDFSDGEIDEMDFLLSTEHIELDETETIMVQEKFIDISKITDIFSIETEAPFEQSVCAYYKELLKTQRIDIEYFVNKLYTQTVSDTTTVSTSTKSKHATYSEATPSTYIRNTSATQPRRRKRKSKFTTKSKRKSSKTEKKEEKESVCPLCKCIYIDGDAWITCDLCDLWYDRKCLKLNDDQWHNLEGSDWYCPECLK